MCMYIDINETTFQYRLSTGELLHMHLNMSSLMSLLSRFVCISFSFFVSICMRRIKKSKATNNAFRPRRSFRRCNRNLI